MYNLDLYNIYFKKHDDKIVINMQINNTIVSTRYLPHTYDFLSLNFPSVLRTECFNDDKIPFHIEVKNTELGHLFEHMLLENLCKKKLASGYQSAEFSGRTNWNWTENPYGFFSINIGLENSDFKYFNCALVDTIRIFNLLLKAQ